MNRLNSICCLLVAVVLASLLVVETADAQEEYSATTQDIAGAQESPLLKRYQDEVKTLGGNTLFECKEADCGVFPLQNSTSRQGLASNTSDEGRAKNRRVVLVEQ